MKKRPGQAREKIKVPNGVLYFVVYILFYPFFKLFFWLKVDRDGYMPPKGPFVVVSNHVSFMDFLLIMLTIYPHRLNAVAAQKFFLYRPLNWLLPFMGCIPKNLFDPDIRSIKGMMAVLKRGGNVLLYPEGRCTVAGAYMGMHTSTGKLLKKFGAPVVSCRIDGAYTCMPFWRKGIRFGRERVTLVNLINAEDIRTLSVDEINRRIDESLNGINAKAPAKPFCVFRPRRLLEGLQNIIYYCPRCGAEFTLETRGNSVRCTKCGNMATMDREARLIPASGCTVPVTVQQWYKEQTIHEMQSLYRGMEPIKVDVNVRMPGAPGKGIVYCGKGVLSLEPEGWRYEGELNGNDMRLVFPIETVPAMPFDPNDNFQIYANGSFYSFAPEGRAVACAKYATIGECAYWKFASPIQMTPGYESGFCENPHNPE